MGNSRWSDSDWNTYSSTTRSLSQSEIFSRSKMVESLNPKFIQLRESCDSQENPRSTPIILGLDVTGSMGMIANNMAKEGLGTLVTQTLEQKPVSDPHFMFMGIGDSDYDSAPLQVTQFEADIKIGDQLREMWLEKGGGNNSFESYHLPWHFAATRTNIDSFAKHGRKGYLFTVGDELPPNDFTTAHQEKIYGRSERNYTIQELLAMAREKYYVYHLIVNEGSYARSHLGAVTTSWQNLLGQNAVNLTDYRELANVVVRLMAENERNLPQEEAPDRVMDLS